MQILGYKGLFLNQIEFFSFFHIGCVRVDLVISNENLGTFAGL